MGNNLGLSGSSPSLASVTIGSSPGYPGNNSLAITYHTWQSAGNTSADNRSITYRLEDMDPTDDDIQLVRREDDGSVVVVAKHIVNAADVVFSGSAETSPGVASSGLNLNITSTLEGSTATVSRQASFVFTLPRTYQPTLAPAPRSQTWNMAVPAFVRKDSGYWEVITTAATGNISATWQIQSPAEVELYIYSGEPFGRPLGDSKMETEEVNASVVASNEATTNNLTATTATLQPAGKYTVYFFVEDPENDSDYVRTVSARVTYISP